MVKTASTKEKKKQVLDLEREVSFLLSEKVLKKEREQQILKNRYGLFGLDIKTLEEIGRNLKITRERVRQIEKSALGKVANAASKIESLNNFFIKVENTINQTGGVINEERLVSKFINTKNQDQKNVNAFLFLARLNRKISKHNENKEFRAYWYTLRQTTKKIVTASEIIDEVFDTKKKVLSESELAKEIAGDVNFVEAVLWTKKNVLQNEEKKWGLATWREVNPKSIRDKTYIILKKYEKPLHYEEITEKITKHKFQKRPVTKQAVHNELIRDPRFILIGRGIYALGEWGYSPGVVEDVIKEILKTSDKPLHKNEIIRLVKEKRIVKETTIILNLQKKSFKRVARATYTLSED